MARPLHEVRGNAVGGKRNGGVAVRGLQPRGVPQAVATDGEVAEA